MKIGVISDTHLRDKNESLPKEIQEGLKPVDMIIHAGDLVDLSVLEKLKKICPQVIAVRGNMDPEPVRKILPEKEIIKVGKFRIGLAHGQGHPAGLPDLLLNMFRNDLVDAIVFGHSHNPLNEVRNGILLFNPGSATDKVFAEYNSYGILEINDKIEGRIIRI